MVIELEVHFTVAEKQLFLKWLGWIERGCHKKRIRDLRRCPCENSLRATAFHKRKVSFVTYLMFSIISFPLINPFVWSPSFIYKKSQSRKLKVMPFGLKSCEKLCSYDLLL